MKRFISVILLLVTLGAFTYFSISLIDDAIKWNGFRESRPIPISEILQLDMTVRATPHSTVYDIDVKYKYSFEGESYEGDQLTVHGKKDHLDNNKKLYQKIKKKKEAVA